MRLFIRFLSTARLIRFAETAVVKKILGDSDLGENSHFIRMGWERWELPEENSLSMSFELFSLSHFIPDSKSWVNRGYSASISMKLLYKSCKLSMDFSGDRPKLLPGFLIGNRQFVSAFGSSSGEDFSAVFCGHAGSESVLVRAFSSRWLECPFHGLLLFCIFH